MIIHNITYCVDRPLVPAFLEWVRTEVVPQAESEGLEVQALARVMSTPDPDSESYALQLLAQGLADVRRWTRGPGASLAAAAAARWGQRVLPFATNLQVL